MGIQAETDQKTWLLTDFDDQEMLELLSLDLYVDSPIAHWYELFRSHFPLLDLDPSPSIVLGLTTMFIKL